MTVRVEAPNGARWVVRRSVVRGRDGHGRRWRWRAPSWLGDLAGVLQLGELAEIPVIGIVIVAILAPVAIAVIAVLVPFLALAVLEAILLGVLLGVGLVGATVLGKPILVRATFEPPPAAKSPDGELPPPVPSPQPLPITFVCAVKGWRNSRARRDQVVNALLAGVDPATIADGLIVPAANARP